MPSTDRDVQCREIITKAVCGKGRKFSQRSHTITPKQSPSNILGCWIINHTFEASKVGDVIEVAGSYDVQIWVSFNNNTDTAVIKERVSYVDNVALSFFDNNCRGRLDIHAQAIQQPNCLEARIVNGDILVKVESEFAVEVVGETKLCVVICDNCEDEKDVDFDDFEDMEDFEDFDPDSIIDDLD